MRSGTAQSFLESVNNATSLQNESGDSTVSPTETGACNCCCRCGRAPKWNPQGPRGRRSKSYTALRTGISELSGWDWEPPKYAEPIVLDVVKTFGPGEAPLERLPAEILGEKGMETASCEKTANQPETDGIIAQLALDVPPSGYTPRNVDLVSCLLASKTIHVATVNTLYNHITIPHSSIFSKFMTHLAEYPGLGKIVRRLDLSHFTSVGLGRTRQMNSEIQNMTSKTLLRCLELTPAIQEVLLQEHVDDDINEEVLGKLFFGLPKLRAVDFCGASSTPFVDSFSMTISSLVATPSMTLGIRRLGLHECFTLPSSALEGLLPRLPQLTHLDVSHTRITDKALVAIPNCANLTHLNLGRCNQITGDRVVDFLCTHPAVKNLVYLNLYCDIARYRLLWASDVDRLLPSLPASLRSLTLSGAQIRASHIPLLLPLTKHLEELSLGFAELSLRDINSLFHPPAPSEVQQELTWTPHSLHYLDLTGIPAISQASLFSSTCTLLAPSTAPLEVLELGDKAISALRECKNTNKRLGWVVKELGRRGWYVREPERQADQQESMAGGRRSWKMGAIWWGMRKVPVAWGEVGGLYGHYMFKK